METPFWFDVDGTPALGMLHEVKQPGDTGMLLIVGGPQYRVGSHRQFVLLARAVARFGVPVLRFDCRGMGDSPGELRDFEGIEADIAAAADELATRTGVTRIVLWGLCDGASAAMMYAPRDKRVAGIIALNPWVHTELSEARVRLKGYYLQRLLSRDLWRRLVTLQFDWRDSARSLRRYLRQAGTGEAGGNYIERMRSGLERSRVPLFLVLSGDDMTAEEFDDLRSRDTRWRETLNGVLADEFRIRAANHTFARAEWRGAVEARTAEWICGKVENK